MRLLRWLWVFCVCLCRGFWESWFCGSSIWEMLWWLIVMGVFLDMWCLLCWMFCCSWGRS